MKEFDSVVLSDSRGGVQYQLAAALQRLGKKVMAFAVPGADGVAPLEAPGPGKVVAVPAQWSGATSPFSAFVATVEDAIAKNRAPSTDEIERLGADLAKASELQNDAQLIALLPSNTDAAAIERVLAAGAQRTTVFLTPAIYGLRDGNIFDHALAAFRENPATRLAAGDEGPLALVYSPDVVGILVGLLLTRTPGEFPGKVIDIPGALHRPAEFLEEFQTVFRAALARTDAASAAKVLVGGGPSLLRKLWPFAGANRWKEETQWLAAQPTRQERSATGRRHLPALDFFPTRMTPLRRALEQSAAHFFRDPEAQSHFFPSRAL